MSELQWLQFRGMVQGGVMACITSVITRLVIDKPITEHLIIGAFAIGFAASFFTLSVAWTRGFYRQGTGEGSAWFGFVVVLSAGVVAGVVDLIPDELFMSIFFIKSPLDFIVLAFVASIALVLLTRKFFQTIEKKDRQENGVSYIDFYNAGVKNGIYGNFEKARMLFQAVLELHYDIPSRECLQLTEDAINHRIKKEAAIKMFKSVGYNDSMFSKNDTKNLYKAIQAVKAAIEIDPNYPRAYTDLGAHYGKLDQTEDAIANFQKAISIDPYYGPAHYNLHIAYSKIGKHELAIKHKKIATHLGFTA